MGYYTASPQLQDGESILDTIQNIAKSAEGYIQQGANVVKSGTNAYNAAAEAYNTATGGGGTPVKNPEQYQGTHEPQYGQDHTAPRDTEEGMPADGDVAGGAVAYANPGTNSGNGKTFFVVGLMVAAVGYIAKTWGR